MELNVASKPSHSGPESDFGCNPLVLTQVDLFVSEARVCPDVEVTPDSDAEHGQHPAHKTRHSLADKTTNMLCTYKSHLFVLTFGPSLVEVRCVETDSVLGTSVLYSTHTTNP